MDVHALLTRPSTVNGSRPFSGARLLKVLGSADIRTFECQISDIEAARNSQGGGDVDTIVDFEGQFEHWTRFPQAHSTIVPPCSLCPQEGGRVQAWGSAC